MTLWGGQPAIVTEEGVKGRLQDKTPADLCRNNWCRRHWLSASVGDCFYLLTSDRSLVRYSWQDIENGNFSKREFVFAGVADF